MIEPVVLDGGNIRLYCGDCLPIMASWPECFKVDCVVTDWPYNKVNRADSGLRSFDKGDADSSPVDVPKVVAAMCRISSGSLYCWCGTEQVSDARRVMVDAGLSTRLGFWHKSNPPVANGQHLYLSAIECCVYGKHPRATFNRHCKAPVWYGPIARNAVHPTQKPLWLIEEQVAASTDPDDTVFDPYHGSGTTGVACVRLGRKFIGCEIGRTYFDGAVARIQKELDLRDGSGPLMRARPMLIEAGK